MNNTGQIIEIYWYDLTQEKQQELLDAGYDNGNVVDGVFPLAEILIDIDEDE